MGQVPCIFTYVLESGIHQQTKRKCIIRAIEMTEWDAGCGMRDAGGVSDRLIRGGISDEAAFKLRLS